MTTAQDVYKAMMRDNVAPRLRALGWKGSGQRYELSDPEAWVQLGFQPSRDNNSSSVSFTINVSVIDKQAWAVFRNERPALPARPNPSVHYNNELSLIGIGHLLYGKTATWWNISVDRPLDHVEWVANGVHVAVVEYAMPEIHRLTCEARDSG